MANSILKHVNGLTWLERGCVLGGSECPQQYVIAFAVLTECVCLQGLSLTTFALDWQAGPNPAPAKVSAGDTLKLDITVKNSGSREGDEVVMVYHVPGKLERFVHVAIFRSL